jgi:ribonucleoside-diphosphate reductase alpha chain
MQAAFQEHCDSAISKTTNFSHTGHAGRRPRHLRAGVRDEVQGRHGVPRRFARRPGALHRRHRGCRRQARRRPRRIRRSSVSSPSSRGSSRSSPSCENDRRTKKVLFDAEAENLQRRQKRSRPDILRSTAIRKETPLGVMFVHITEDDKGQPFEVFINLGKAGGSAMADAEAMGRMISLALRSGIPIQQVHRQLRGISSDRAVGSGRTRCSRCRTRSARARGLDAHQAGRAAGAAHHAGDALVAVRRCGDAAVAAVVTQGGAQMSFEAVNSGDAFIGTCPDCGSAAGVRGGVREVPCVRVLRVRVS